MLNVLIAIALFLVSAAMSLAVLVAGMLFMAFSSAGASSPAQVPWWIEHLAVPFAIVVLVLGAISPPTLFLLGFNWKTIAISFVICIGLFGLLVMLAILQLLKS